MFRPPPPFLIGMIHLPPLPGSVHHTDALSAIVKHALADANVLCLAGFDGLMMENFGDAPFAADELEPVTVAAMAIVAAAIKSEVDLPLGINALRNDAASALGIAVAAGASFVRINVHTGISATDQGFIQGKADQTVRLRQRLGPNIAIYADVHVKHAVPLNQPDIALAAEETAYRGCAQGIVVTGSTTGRSADLDAVRRVKEAVPDRMVLVGSGATADTVAEILSAADGVIVGSSLKPEGRTDQPIDPALAQAFIRAARS